jgi:hypothetical protein
VAAVAREGRFANADPGSRQARVQHGVPASAFLRAVRIANTMSRVTGSRELYRRIFPWTPHLRCAPRRPASEKDILGGGAGRLRARVEASGWPRRAVGSVESIHGALHDREPQARGGVPYSVPAVHQPRLGENRHPLAHRGLPTVDRGNNVLPMAQACIGGHSAPLHHALRPCRRGVSRP